MNKKFMIKIPLKGTDKEEYNGKSLNFSINTLLYPYYLSESALLSVFLEGEDYRPYRNLSQELIFNASLRAYEFSMNKLGNIPEEHKLIFRRELALCLAMNSFANHFYKNLNNSITRSKSYADFSVSTTVKNDGVLLKNMISSSSNCIEEAKEAINKVYMLANSIGATTVKGVNNISNSFSYRTWIHSNLPVKSSGILANNKVWFAGNLYKDGPSYVPKS